ncbi:MAG: NADH-quinone oxidoreductase subunit NuoE [Sedimentisphaerales bacterium]|nr:NADH-quinone oxidoreductase subunit NuoE [Sedimentisphaerales bacterium]
MSSNTGEKVGAVLVVGAGVGGMQASLDLAEAGYKVYLVDKGPSIGGVMAQLDKTFPTNDCAMCTLAPRMVDCGGHLNIEKLTYSEIESIEGEAGNFNVKIRKKARSVDPDKCTGCGECSEHCLVKNIVYLEPPAVPKIELEADDLSKVDEIIGRYSGGRESLLPILQSINTEFNWLPEGMLRRVAEIKQIPIEHILRLATFYKSFSLEPRGKHIVTVCTGTACHVKGAPRILERFERDLGIQTGQTTSDMQFTLEAVRCIGCCGLSPVITIGEDLYGKLSPAEAAKILERYRD